MKKFLLFFLTVTLVILTIFSVVACDRNPDPPKSKTIEKIEKPKDLPDYSLSIEWINESGDSTTFVSNKPTVVFFNGYSEFDRKESLSLQADVYTPEVVSANASIFDRNVASYWNGYNIGIFHYENFADDDLEVVCQKILNPTTMSYKNKDGALKKVEFTLIEAFVSAWSDAFSKRQIAQAIPIRPIEIHFVGNSVGANLALISANAICKLYDEGLFTADMVPNRVSILNPYFTNSIDYASKKYNSSDPINSQLLYAKEIVNVLSNRGIALEMVENDRNFYASYKTPYSGVTKLTHEAYEGVYEIIFGDGEDSNAYKEIKSKVAYLNYAEAYSEHYPETYQKYDRATLDWYLYSKGGSDNSGSLGSKKREDGFYPVYDMLGHTSVTHNEYTESPSGGYSVKYGISAWTPTVYIRAIMGTEFIMKKHNTSAGTNTGYVSQKFQSELFQSSNITQDNGVFICGYVYESKDDSKYVNLRPDAAIKNVKVSIIITKTGSEYSRTVNVTTDSTGFYRYYFEKSDFLANVQVRVMTPSPEYKYLQGDLVVKDSTKSYKLVETNSIDKDENKSTVHCNEASNYYIMFRNCGFERVNE